MCVVSVVAKAVQNLVYEDFMNNDMLKISQYDFRPSHSTVFALLDNADKCCQNINIGQLNKVGFLDRNKASVPYYRI